jgi:hypothetical protein
MPGEVSHEIGRAYVFVLSGCLQRAVKDFKPIFNVYSAPEKLSFHGFSGTPYSFDLSGYVPGAEVFVESKGYKDGNSLLDAYREFLAKAYCTSVQFARHRRDQFWFATNVPFGSSFGRALVDSKFVGDSLRENKSPGGAAILGDAVIDDGHVRSLVSRLAIGIFTDSFIKVMGTLYRFQPGDNLWIATKLLHGGRIPLPQFDSIVSRVVGMNNLRDPNHIRSGQLLHLPWFGISEYGLES